MKSPPPEVPAAKDLGSLAPEYRLAVARVLDRMRQKGFDAVIAETIRTPERQEFLFGFGREYDDGRGVVTNSRSALYSWHGYGLAVDIVSGAHGWDAPASFWQALEECAMAEDLTSGADWNRNGVHDEKLCDKPHVQWWCAGMRVSPSDHARELYRDHGVEWVWKELHAA
jgi:peptidoglycan L-alanyl-D-glutamate endopeptidase CwlK